MRTPEQMKGDAQKYLLAFDEDDKQVWLVKGNGYVELRAKRAIDWVLAGINDLDCRSEEKMLEILKRWISEGKK